MNSDTEMIHTNLNSEFIKEMKDMLGGEFDEFMECYNQPHRRGIRINTLKFDIERSGELGLPLEKCPFAPDGFYLNLNENGIGTSPWHHSGAFYSQEPSAMSAVTILAPKPGEKILDMCAAPGGKSTQIAALLKGRGLLWSNEYVRKRAQILLSNIERMGVRNCVVSNAHPDVLAQNLSGFFDRVLVDAPCSGEGMFRRDDTAVSEWSREHSESCALRQLAVLDSAAKCVRGGGVLVYSTCTFSYCENEDVVIKFLESHPEFSVYDSGVNFGRAGYNRSNKFDLTLSRRIFPMDGGEGHFAVKLIKSGESFDNSQYLKQTAPTDGEKSAAELFEQCFECEPYGRIIQIGDCCYIVPKDIPNTHGLGVLRGGVLLGEIRRNRIEPAHSLFMAADSRECRRIISLEPNSTELAAFLHGEELSVSQKLKGYAAVSCGDTVTGFGKCSAGRLKNKYPKGLRLL